MAFNVPDRRARLLETMVILLCELSLGMVNGIIGPSLLDLVDQVHTDLETIPYIVTARAVGHVTGCLVCELHIPNV